MGDWRKHLLAHGAGNALGLDVDVDDVLLQVEAVWESLPAVLANPRLHTPPSVPWVGCLRMLARWSSTLWSRVPSVPLVARERGLDLLKLLGWNKVRNQNRAWLQIILSFTCEVRPPPLLLRFLQCCWEKGIDMWTLSLWMMTFMAIWISIGYYPKVWWWIVIVEVGELVQRKGGWRDLQMRDMWGHMVYVW